ncbi:MAG: tRNA pseudouridine(54/55) synthase Pus10 [Candidatus Thermoplasmatota archaeon]
MDTPSLQNSLLEVLHTYTLCDACLGRQFKNQYRGKTNAEKGIELRKMIHYTKTTSPENCWLCHGLILEIPHFVGLVQDALQDYEYTTFLIGTKIDEDIQRREEEIFNTFPFVDQEPIKMELNREIGKKLELKLNKIVDFKDPDITVILDTVFYSISLQITSIYFYGRYKKFERGIPQTRWPCRVCQGIGCRRCQYTGKMYQTSVEELISAPILQKTQGTDTAFHGSGREDIDALMLGNGRPFILEIKNPKIRTISLSILEQEINSANKNHLEISDLRYSDKQEIIRLKDAEFQKTYQIVIQGAQPFSKEKLIKVTGLLQGTTIKQFTPTRVAHRRAHKVREKKIYTCSVDSVEGVIARLTITAESGTYIKELVSGDNGQTQPNISDLLGIPCIVKELNVVEVKGE